VLFNKTFKVFKPFARRNKKTQKKSQSRRESPTLYITIFSFWRQSPKKTQKKATYTYPPFCCFLGQIDFFCGGWRGG
jgi:hypothetical protein